MLLVAQSITDAAADAASSLADAAASFASSTPVPPVPPSPVTPGEHLDLLISKATALLSSFTSFASPYVSSPYAYFVSFSLLLVSTTIFFHLFPPSSIIRHLNWLLDTLWAGPCIVAPDYMDRVYTKKFLAEFESDSLASASPSKSTIGIILVMGAQNAGCHLVYWKLLRELKPRLESKTGCNVVFEINRWCQDGPMSHADKALSSSRFPPSRLGYRFVRRIVGDYIGIPIMFLNHSYAVDSVEASRLRFHKRLLAAGLYSNASVCILAHSMGGPVAYRYLQSYPTTKIDRLISLGSMNHYTNPYCGLKTDPRKGTSPYFPVRCPHLDVLDGDDFLSFPFYQSNHGDDHLPKPDHNHYTRWVEEGWCKGVFAHTGYAHCESFYGAVEAFFS